MRKQVNRLLRPLPDLLVINRSLLGKRAYSLADFFRKIVNRKPIARVADCHVPRKIFPEIEILFCVAEAFG